MDESMYILREDMDSPSLKLHALILVWPRHGHLAPALHLASNFLSHGFSLITFANSHRQLPSFRHHLHQTLPPALHPRIQLVGLPDGCPPHQQPTSFNRAFVDTLEAMTQPFEALAQRLLLDDPPLSCIVSDTFTPWTRRAAATLGLPYVFLWTASGASLSLCLRLPQFLSQLANVRKDENTCDSAESQDSVTYSVPGLPPLLATDLPPFVLEWTADPSSWFMAFMISQFEHLDQVHNIMVHSCYDLETEAFDCLKTAAPLCPVGPLVPSVVFDNNVLDSEASEQDECLSWLDTQPACSVLYISLGSTGSFSVTEIQQLAEAVDTCRQAFLWVIRPNSAIPPLSEVLPEGFLSSIGEKGLIIPWAPQMRVLAHPAVGGFLTHCGWNSTLESICAGVPMIALPLGAEQPMNAKYIVDEWKIGVRLRKNEGGRVETRELEELVKCLMQGEEGKAMRERAKRLGATVQKAVMKGGSSDANLQAFVEDMLQLQTQRQMHEKSSD